MGEVYFCIKIRGFFWPGIKKGFFKKPGIKSGCFGSMIDMVQTAVSYIQICTMVVQQFWQQKTIECIA